MDAYTRNTTQGLQVTVFDSYGVRSELRSRGYRFSSSLPRPMCDPRGWRYGPVSPGWFRCPVDPDEIAYLDSLGVRVMHVTEDGNTAIQSVSEY